MYQVIHVLVRLLTPILAFTSEEIWRYLPKIRQPGERSIDGLAPGQSSLPGHSLGSKWKQLLKVRDEVAKALELARQEKTIGNS